MEYHDRIYGTEQIVEPVLLALMDAPTVRRLEEVLQHGISGLIGITRGTSRFEHSLGVMILVKRLAGSLEEQIAALLHDVSHTAFSHVMDYVFGSYESQSYHEDVKEQFIEQSELPAILTRYGYDWRIFLDEARYPLLEQPAPALCADRLDYFLRDVYDLGLGSMQDIQAALTHLVVHNGRIAVNDQQAARWMGYTFIEADQASWANFREVGIYELTARAIRTALRLGVLEDSDIWTGDARVWQKMKAARHPLLQKEMALISTETGFVWDERAPTFRIRTKLRTIDPEIVLPVGLQPLSGVDAAFAQYRSQYLSRNSGSWPMRVIPADGRSQA
jgi:HD superfamily phosphohydrolase